MITLLYSSLSDRARPCLLNKKKKKRNTEDLNNTINQLDLIDIYRLCHPSIAKDTFFPSVYGTLTKTDYIPCYKTKLPKFKSIEIMQNSLITTELN